MTIRYTIERLLFVTLGSLLIVACSSDDVAVSPISSQETPIVFAANVNKTRAKDLIADATTQEIGIYGIWKENTTTTHTDFIDNYRGWYEGGAWDYEPHRFWPQIGSVSFYAYMPKNSESIISRTVSVDGPTITFTPMTDAGQQTELLTAKPVTNRGPYNNGTTPQTVTFEFYHALAQVRFYAAYYFDESQVTEGEAHFDPDKNYVHIDSIRFNKLIGTKYVNPSNDKDKDYCDWQVDEYTGNNSDSSYFAGISSMESGNLQRVTDSPTISDASSFMSEDRLVTKRDGSFLLLPQKMSDNASIDIYYSFKAKSTSNDNLYSTLTAFNVNVPMSNLLDIDRTLSPGKIKNYCFIINCNDASVASFTSVDSKLIEDWKDGGTNSTINVE